MELGKNVAVFPVRERVRDVKEDGAHNQSYRISLVSNIQFVKQKKKKKNSVSLVDMHDLCRGKPVEVRG
jgi:hypothetical protein